AVMWGSSSSECQVAVHVDARARAQTVRDRDVEPQKRRGDPDAAADAAHQPLIGEALAVVVRGSGVDEGADPELGQLERRGQRNAQLERSGDERIAQGGSG